MVGGPSTEDMALARVQSCQSRKPSGSVAMVVSSSGDLSCAAGRDFIHLVIGPRYPVRVIE